LGLARRYPLKRRDRLFRHDYWYLLKSPKTKKLLHLEAEVAAGRKTKEQAQTEAGMKKGGKVSSSLQTC
jgi:hypothetical protein